MNALIQKSRSLLILVLAFAVNFTVVADAFGAPDSEAWVDYVEMLVSDSDGTAGNLDAPAFNTDGRGANSGFKWSDELAPHAEARYYIGPGKQLMFLSGQARTGDWTFDGDELVLDSTAKIILNNRNNEPVTIPDLRVQPGAVFVYYSTSRAPFFGTLHVETTKESPLLLNYNCYEFRYASEMGMDLVGGENAQITLFCDYWHRYPARESHGYFSFTGDNSAYRGTICVSNNCYLYVNDAMPGTVDVWDTGRFYTDYYMIKENGSAATLGGDVAPKLAALRVRSGGIVNLIAKNHVEVGDLTLEDGAQLWVHHRKDSSGHFENGYLKVTNSVTVSGKVVVKYPETLPFLPGEAAPSFKFLELADGVKVNFSESNFQLETSTANYDLPHASVAIVDGSVVLQCKEIVKLLRTSKSESSRISPLNSAQDEDGNWFWSDHDAPQSGKDYYSTLTGKISTPPDPNRQPVKFNGDSFVSVGTKYAGASGTGTIGGLAFDDFGIAGGYFQAWNGASRTARDIANTFEMASCVYSITGGVMRTYAGSSIKMEPFLRCLFRIASEIRGDGEFLAQTYSSDPRCFYEFTGLNTNFSGRIHVTSSSPSEENFVAFNLFDGRNIGGARETFTPNAFEIDQMSMLHAIDSTAIDQTNLGVRIAGLARFYVDEGKTLAVKNTITYDGILRKEGAGTLALGAAPRFGDGTLAEAVPTTGNNILRVNEGWIKPLSSDACKNLAVEVNAETAGLRIDADTTDAALLANGLTGMQSFALGVGVKELAVVIDSEKKYEGESAYAVCTLPVKSDAEALAAKIKTVLPASWRSRGVHASTAVVENGGAYTIQIKTSVPGLLIIFW